MRKYRDKNIGTIACVYAASQLGNWSLRKLAVTPGMLDTFDKSWSAWSAGVGVVSTNGCDKQTTMLGEDVSQMPSSP
jgi:hypothetical protein